MERNSSELLLQQIRSCTNLIHRLMHSEHRCRHHEGVESGIGRGQGMVLRILAERDGLAQSELAEELDIRPSSLGELVTKLEESGLIQRRRNEDNRRVVNVFLTEAGREAEKQLSAPRRQAAETWCSGLSDEEKEQLAGLLEKLIGSMESALAKNEGECSDGENPLAHGFPEDGWGGHGPHGGPDDPRGWGGHGPHGGSDGPRCWGGRGPHGGPDDPRGCGGREPHGGPDGPRCWGGRGPHGGPDDPRGWGGHRSHGGPDGPRCWGGHGSHGGPDAPQGGEEPQRGRED